MRTRPLPNRHAADLSDFFETVQATLNRNRAKGDLEDISFTQLIDKLEEEMDELKDEMLLQAWRVRGIELQRSVPMPELWKVEREAADLAVCALAAWIWARRKGEVDVQSGR